MDLNSITRLFRLKSSPQSIKEYQGIGYVYRIPRYDSQGNHLIGYIRNQWTEEFINRNEYFSAYFIVGELSSIKSIETILQNPDFNKYCEKIHVIFGPKIHTKNSKDKLKELLREHKKLELFSCTNRPEDHGFMINDKIMYEEKHPPGLDYTVAVLIEHASINARNEFLSRFNSLKATARKITLDNIDEIETYE